MKAYMQELLHLISEYYWDHSQYCDSYELQALQESAEEDIDALNTMCHHIFGTHTHEMYLSVLDSICDYCDFILENYKNPAKMSEEAIDIIVECTTHRSLVANCVCSILSLYGTSIHAELCKVKQEKIHCASDQIYRIFTSYTNQDSNRDSQVL